MNAVDATDRESQTESGVPASLLTIILDTNPHAWALLTDELPLSKVVANLLVFINSHLAINNANRVAVVASHVQRAQWLYPSPTLPKSSGGANGHANGVEDTPMSDSATRTQRAEDPNKYRPFAHIEHTLTTNLRTLMSSTNPPDLVSTPSTMTAGALTMALAYISKAALTAPTATSSTTTYNAAAGTFTNPDGNNSGPGSIGGTATQGLTSRILILSVSGDLSDQYIAMMNAIFACQRLHCPIDILKLAGDTVFLQQAADATGGIYTSLSSESNSPSSTTIANGTTATPSASGAVAKTAGILQYLLLAYLPDPSARQHLHLPGQSHGVDFRAACFCHRKVVDVGFVCSICLSIFCEPTMLGEDGSCLTCGTALRVGDYGMKPIVVGRRKKKKRDKAAGRGAGLDEGREGTPG